MMKNIRLKDNEENDRHTEVSFFHIDHNNDRVHHNIDLTLKNRFEKENDRC